MSPVDDGSPPEPRVSVQPSAPMELLWISHLLLNPRPEVAELFAVIGQDRATGLAERWRDFWGDGISGGAGELVILADYAGLLFAPNLDQLLEDLPVPTGDFSRVGLRSESPADRPRFAERLGRLQREPKVRQRYVDLLGAIWEPMRSEWESKGLPQVLAACRRTAERLDLGAPLDQVVPAMAQVTRKKSDWKALIDRAQATGRLVLTPGYFGGKWSLWDLPEHVVLGFNGNVDTLGDAQSMGQRLAPRLRALGDPTRLSILFYLSERPTSVGELARQFRLAQPTVSAHLRALRDASLVVGTRSGGRTVYQVDRDPLERLLGDLAESSGVELSD